MSFLTTVLPVHNGEKLLGNTLRSIAWQTRKPDRIVVLNNASTDKTAEVAKSIEGIIVECVTTEENIGCFGNMNKALSYASETDYLHILHHDDLIKPQFYEVLLGGLATAAAPSMAYCKGKNYEAGQMPEEASSTLSSPPKVRELTTSEFVGNRAELKAFPFCSVVIKTERKPTKSQFRTDLKLHGDMVFWSDLAAESRKVVEVDSVLLLNGIHPRSNYAPVQTWLNIVIKDEWRAIQMIEEKRGYKGFGSWVRKQKLACKFAARCAIKRKKMMQEYPDAAKQIKLEATSSIGLLRWFLGLCAAKLRGQA